MSENAAESVPAPSGLVDVAEALCTTIQALTQATEVLRGIAAQIGQSAPEIGGPEAEATAVHINVWEDDPFSETRPTPNPATSELITEQAPDPGGVNLSWQIAGTRPAPGLHVPGTSEFRYWIAEASMSQAIRYWTSFTPHGTRWSTVGAGLGVTLVAGENLNAFYSRQQGLRFFQKTVDGTDIFTAESPDVVRHELGHAVLDALRPELFHAASIEADAFHEAFGDMSAILAALQRQSFRQRVLSETQGRLTISSRMSRVAEQLAWGIRRRLPDAVDQDCLRNAANRFLYQTPSSLPPVAPASQLSTEPHSFARVFTGAFLDALAAMVDVAEAPANEALHDVSCDLGQLLVDAVLTAPVTPTYFSQVAAAMVQAARARDAGRYQSAVLGAFVRRGILDLTAARDLEAAPVPSFQPADAGRASSAHAAGANAADAGADGSSSVLGYGASSSAGVHANAASAPGLPLLPVHAEFLDQDVLCHAAAEQPRFAVTPAVYAPSDIVPTDATDSARHYLATLIRLGRIDPGPASSMVRGPTRPDEDRTHKLERQSGGLVLERIQFACT